VELAAIDDVGSVAWLERSGGHLSRAERSYLLRGMFGMIRAGFRLRSHAKRSGKRDLALATLEPPETPMVSAARAHLVASSGREMVNHSMRTGFWTGFVLAQHGELTPELLETTWVAALLHDVGLEATPARGDFSAGGIDVLKQLAVEHAWSEAQVHDASEAIAVNLTTRADPSRLPAVAWAMNVGGAGELGIWPHRAQVARNRVRELEARFPRDGFRRVALRLIRAEAERIPDGRFALFRRVYWLLVR
jgi:hypothetical protein